MPAVNVVLLGAGDGRRLVDRSVKLWVASGADAVGGGDGQRVGAAGARGGRAGEGGRAVAVVHEGDAARAARPVSLRAAVGKPVVVTVNVPAAAHGERGAVGAGDGRGLVDGEREALGGVGRDAVGGGDGQRVGAAAARRRRAARGWRCRRRCRRR